jgi:hypothetical protein
MLDQTEMLAMLEVEPAQAHLAMLEQTETLAPLAMEPPQAIQEIQAQ